MGAVKLIGRIKTERFHRTQNFLHVDMACNYIVKLKQLI